MSETTYRAAITAALADELSADDAVFLLGEDIAAAGGVFKVTDGLFERFGPRRVLDTPISEQAIVGTAIGAASQGLRPVAEIMFADFAAVCFDQLVNQAPKYRYMTGGQVSLPMTVRLVNGAGAGFGAQHSQPVENWFLNVAGLKVVAPSSPQDAYGLLRAAVRDPDPVLYFEHKNLYNRAGPVEPAMQVPIGVADVVRAGTDCTIVASQQMRHRASEACERLLEAGINVELIDPRTLHPFDGATVAASVAKTNRLVCVQEASSFGSWGASLIAAVVQDSFEDLDAPPLMIGAPAAPIPYSGVLEEQWVPTVERIVEGVKAVVAY